MTPHWPAGHEIVWRYMRPGHPSESARPVRVVRDDADGLVAWLAPGTPVLRPVLADGSELRSLPLAERFLLEPYGRATLLDSWRGQGVLKVAPAGAPWSVWLFWSDDWDFRGWYVNLEDVHRRDGDTVVTQDHVLDLVVDADHLVARKDEDELEVAVRNGRFRPDEADRFRQDAAAVEAAVRQRASPFRDGWEHFRPDPTWPVPALPPALVRTADYRRDGQYQPLA